MSAKQEYIKAKEVYVDKIEVDKSLVLPTFAAYPNIVTYPAYTPVAGQLYFNTTTHVAMVYTGTAWAALN